MSEFITRFAPSPTGFLHLGHAYSALAAFEAAKAAGGKFLLRIEDIDRARCRPEFEQAIMQDLAWLGIEWEEPVRRQSDHFDDYEKALEKLRERGVVYRCFKTRKQIAEEIARAPHLSPDGPEGPQYIGEMLSACEQRALLSQGKPFAWRLSMAAARDYLGSDFKTLSFMEEWGGPKGEIGTLEARPQIFGDPVIARKDSATSYHLASVHDDALQTISHVVRGRDLFPACHLHRLLQALLDLPVPAYRHHKLLLDENAKRFAKRDRAATLRHHRDAGARPQDVRARLGFR